MAEPLRNPDAPNDPPILRFSGKSSPAPSGAPKDPTVAEVIRAYLDELELEHSVGGYSDGTIVAARHYLKSFGEMYGISACPSAPRSPSTSG